MIKHGYREKDMYEFITYFMTKHEYRKGRMKNKINIRNCFFVINFSQTHMQAIVVLYKKNIYRYSA